MGRTTLRQAGFTVVGLGHPLLFRGEPSTIAGYVEAPGSGERLVVLEGVGGKQTTVGWAELWTAAEAMAVRRSDKSLLDSLPRADFDDLPTAKQEALLPRIRDTLQILTGSPTGTPELDRSAGILDPEFDPRTTEMADRMRVMVSRMAHRAKPRSRKTLYRDCAGLLESGLNHFVHGNTTAVETLPVIEADIEAELRRFIESIQRSAKLTHRHLVVAARTHFHEAGVELALNDAALTKWVRFLTRGRAHHRESRSRETHANKPKGVFGRLAPTRPGEFVQVDATDAAIHCLFPGFGWARASILVGVDVYSRAVVAMRVVPGRPNSRDVALLLFDMAMPRAMRAGHPYEYQCYCGVPRLVEIAAVDGKREPRFPDSIGDKPAVQPTHVVFDRGREMENLHVMAVAEEVGIGLVYCPPGAPYAKGVIESVNRMITRLQELLPAYKGASPANHPRGVESRALLTVGDLQDAVWTYILEIYHHQPHSELRNPSHPSQRLTPAQAYQDYLDHGGWIPISTRWDRIISFLPRESRKVQDYGLNLHNHLYNSPELVEIRQYLQRGVGAKAIPLTVYHDPYDVTRVFVRHPVTQAWIRVPIWDPMGLAMPPYSQVLANAALDRLRQDNPQGLTTATVSEAEARFQAAWSRGVFEDRREERAAALEAARRAQHAFDLELAGDEFRSFAYGSVEPSGPAEVVYDDDPDDAVLSYDDVDLDGMAWS